ncbi:MAG: hypothetical protein KBT29_08165 [Prevotellaceae bacterium]|nr:hypothetical protein [Candidatus Minthosoma caballi]
MARNFFDSKNRWTYLRIAIMHGTTPGHVYDLAHSKVDAHEKDQRIMHDLKEAKIIHRYH